MRAGRSIVGGLIGASILAISVTIGFAASSQRGTPAPPSSAPAASASEAAPKDTPEAPDDFELVDPRSSSAGLDGVVATLSDLPVELTKRTLKYVERFARDPKGQGIFRESFKRGSKYRPFIEAALLEANLPADLVWLVAIESGFSPQATSPKGAVGLFQFMPTTAERFGLVVSKEFDERRSITRSTDAAIAYLKFLKERYEAWDLALAAYNCGEERLDEALTKAHEILKRAEGEKIAFRELAENQLLPKETANFVPQIHGFSIVAHNRELLGLDNIETLPALRFAEVAIAEGTRLAPIARAAGVSIATLQEYNPNLLADRLPTGQGDVVVNIPPESLAQCIAALPALRARDEDNKLTPVKVGKDQKVASTSDPAGDGAATKKPLLPKRGSTSTAKVTKDGGIALSNGLVVELHSPESESPNIEVTASIEVTDPTKVHARLGDVITLSTRTVRASELRDALVQVGVELKGHLLGDATTRLRAALVGDRKRFYGKTGFLDEFAMLSDRLFPAGHPLHDALLVGPTETADDMFLDIEPTWALKTKISINGPYDADDIESAVEAAFGDVLVPTRAAALASSSRGAVSNGAPHLLVGWASQPLTIDNEAASRLAFLLACHDRIGKLRSGVKSPTDTTTRVLCSIETAPLGTAAWFFVQPAAPLDVAGAEAALGKGVLALTTSAPTDEELATARQSLRVELAKERDSAGVRMIPGHWVQTENDRILAVLDGVEPEDVLRASKRLFNKDHEVVVTSE
ncbi:MAG: lytic transglycosylase domain-containing protein [Polyangiaceae bacterium]